MIEIKVIHEIRQPQQADLLEQLLPFMEKIVSQLDDLMTTLNAVHDDVSQVLDKTKSLEEQLTTLQQTTPPQVDLSAALALASDIRAQLEGTTASTGEATGQPTGDTSGSDTTADTSAPADTSGSADGAGPDQNGADTTADASAGDQSGTDATA